MFLPRFSLAVQVWFGQDKHTCTNYYTAPATYQTPISKYFDRLKRNVGVQHCGASLVFACLANLEIKLCSAQHDGEV